jgi:hypothetical protein
MDLLPAIRKAAIRDLADYEAWKAREMHQIRTDWRSNSAVQRQSRQLQRTGMYAGDTYRIYLFPIRMKNHTYLICFTASSSSASRSGTPVQRDESLGLMGPPQLTRGFEITCSPPPIPLSSYHTATQTPRKRQATLSASSRSDTFTRRIADRTLQLQQREKELAIQSQELKNRELQQRLDREALQFEREQLEFRRALEREQAQEKE